MRKILAVILALPIVLPSAIMAEETQPPKISGDFGPSLLQVAGAMLLIIVLIYASVWVMKKYSLGKIVGSGSLITVIERRNLTPKQALFIVKVGEKRILIGSTENGMTKISDLDDLMSSTPPSGQGSTKPISKFSQILKQAAGSIMPRVAVKEKSLEV